MIPVAVFGALAGALYAARTRAGEVWHMLLTAAARTAVILVHFVFRAGSLRGDMLGDSACSAGRHDDYAAPEAWQGCALTIPEWAFSIGWAALALALLLRRGGFLSISTPVFPGVHACAQYFETFGAGPGALLVAGLTLVGLAVGLAGLFRKAQRGPSAAPDTPSAE